MADRDKRPSPKVLAVLAICLAVFFAAAFKFGLLGSKSQIDRPAPPVKPRPPASAAELAVIAPLAPGAPLEDYTVSDVLQIENGLMRVICTKDSGRVQLDVALSGDSSALVNAGPYSVYYALDNAPDADGQRLARALGAKIHPEVSPPPGMTRFVPQTPPDLGH